MKNARRFFRLWMPASVRALPRLDSKSMRLAVSGGFGAGGEWPFPSFTVFDQERASAWSVMRDEALSAINSVRNKTAREALTAIVDKCDHFRGIIEQLGGGDHPNMGVSGNAASGNLNLDWSFSYVSGPMIPSIMQDDKKGAVTKSVLRVAESMLIDSANRMHDMFCMPVGKIQIVHLPEYRNSKERIDILLAGYDGVLSQALRKTVRLVFYLTGLARRLLLLLDANKVPDAVSTEMSCGGLRMYHPLHLPCHSKVLLDIFIPALYLPDRLIQRDEKYVKVSVEGSVVKRPTYLLDLDAWDTAIMFEFVSGREFDVLDAYVTNYELSRAMKHAT